MAKTIFDDPLEINIFKRLIPNSRDIPTYDQLGIQFSELRQDFLNRLGPISRGIAKEDTYALERLPIEHPKRFLLIKHYFGSSIFRDPFGFWNE